MPWRRLRNQSRRRPLPNDLGSERSTNEADALKRVVTFVGILVLTFIVGIFMFGLMLRLMLPD